MPSGAALLASNGSGLLVDNVAELSTLLLLCLLELLSDFVPLHPSNPFDFQ